MVAGHPIVKADTLKVEDLLALVEMGRIRLPRFQRGLRWRRRDNQLLFDSIIRGYPIGSLLFWKKAVPAERVRFGSVAVDAAEFSDAWLIVDGQQRVTALAGALLGDEPRHSDFAFLIDTATGNIRTSAQNANVEIPLHFLASTESLIPYLHAHPAIDITAASALSKRLREYPLPITVLDTDDENFVKHVFKRLNSSGKPLRQTEIFRALHAGQPAVQSLEQARSVGAQLDFGPLDDEALVRAFKFLAGHDPLEEVELRDEVISGTDFVRGTQEAVLFLKKVAQIPAAELLPYALPVGVLIAFFAKHTRVSERNRSLLGYWFWRGTVKHRFGGDFTSIRKFFGIVGEPEDAAVQSLLETVNGQAKEPCKAPEVSKVANFGTADGKVVRLTMVHAGPLDLRNGSRLDAPRLEPLVLFKKLDHPLAQTVVNRILHPKLPPRHLVSALNTASDTIWKSHLLGARSFDDPAAFLNTRAQALHAAVDDFVDRVTGRYETDRPPLERLLEPAE